MTDNSGAVTSSFNYSAFGELLGDSTNLSTSYLYTGQQYDESTGLYSLRARYYSPEMGRFLTQDTWAYDYQNPVELNRYAYTANNPVNWIDPSGYASFVDFSKALKAAAVTTANAASRLGVSGSFLYSRAILWLYKLATFSGPLAGAVCLVASFTTEADLGPGCDAPIDELVQSGIKSFRRLLQVTSNSSNPLAQATSLIRANLHFLPSIPESGSKNLAVAQIFINNQPLPKWIWGISGRRESETVQGITNIIRRIVGGSDDIVAVNQVAAQSGNDHAERAILRRAYEILQNLVQEGDEVYIVMYTERIPCQRCGGVIEDTLQGIEGTINMAYENIRKFGIDVRMDVIFTYDHPELNSPNGN